MPSNASTELINEPRLVLGTASAMEAVNSMARDIAGTDIPVLLLGESGTGKEVYAGLFHHFSPASQRPLLKLNCSSLTPQTIREEDTSAAPSHITEVST